MTEKRNHPIRSLPVANYSSAIAKAVAWLGDRYLLAKPINSAHRYARLREAGASA